MYSYYAMTSLGLRKYTAPIAPVITFMQITLMILGAGVIGSVIYTNTFGGFGREPGTCQIGPNITPVCLVLYVTYGILFTTMFFERYLGQSLSLHSMVARLTYKHKVKNSEIAGLGEKEKGGSLSRGWKERRRNHGVTPRMRRRRCTIHSDGRAR